MQPISGKLGYPPLKHVNSIWTVHDVQDGAAVLSHHRGCRHRSNLKCKSDCSISVMSYMYACCTAGSHHGSCNHNYDLDGRTTPAFQLPYCFTLPGIRQHTAWKAGLWRPLSAGHPDIVAATCTSPERTAAPRTLCVALLGRQPTMSAGLPDWPTAFLARTHMALLLAL